jgi:hypothetical protein
MRVATWNVNSLKARLDKVTWWIERARPDVLMLQETKLADSGVRLTSNHISIAAVSSPVTVSIQTRDALIMPSSVGRFWRPVFYGI